MDIRICKIWFDEQKIFVEMNDNRIIGAPLELYPRLKNATAKQRSEYDVWNEGKWIHWDKLDEDLSAEGFLQFNELQQV